MNLADDPDEIVRQRVLQEIRHRAGLERPIDVFVALVHRQHDDVRPGGLAADRANRLDAAHRSELQVHQRDVGTVFPVQRHRLLARRGERDDFHVGLPVMISEMPSRTMR